jgi:GTPase SAR1 family protein
MHYRGSHGAFFVFDLTSRSSLEDLVPYLSDFREHSRRRTVGILIGNKMDLDHDREVSLEEAEEFARQHSLLYFEVSCRTGANVNDAVCAGVDAIEDDIDKNGHLEEDCRVVDIGKVEEKQETCC